jgi:ribosomal protein S18 acetylase RimI-like enzyme
MHQDEEHHYKTRLHLALSRVTRRLGFRWYDMYYLERSLHRPLPGFEANVPLEISLANDEDRQEILAGREPVHHKRLQLRFRTAQILCYVARTRGQLAGYSMLRSGLMDMTGLDAIELPICEMPDDTGLTHDAYVWPEFRGQRIFHALLAHVHRDRKAAGYARVCNLIDPANVWSLKVHLDMGARMQRVKFFKLPGTGIKVAGRDLQIGALDT